MHISALIEELGPVAGLGDFGAGFSVQGFTDEVPSIHHFGEIHSLQGIRGDQ